MPRQSGGERPGWAALIFTVGHMNGASGSSGAEGRLYKSREQVHNTPKRKAFPLCKTHCKKNEMCTERSY